jgi:crossover junction endonuclease MUS81
MAVVWPFFNCPMPFTFSCFTTELLEGFDVLRTSGYADTVKTYSNLTSSIIEYYSTNFPALAESSRVCPTYDEFERNCRGLKRKTVSQIFALQLMQVSFATGPCHGSFDAIRIWMESYPHVRDVHPMQVPQVTEQVALVVIELYPTLLSLARAYSMLVSPLVFVTFHPQLHISYLLVFQYYYHRTG